MSAARVLVVEHQGNAGLNHFAERIAAAGVETVVVGPDAGREIPDSLAGFAGLIVLGGAMGPTEDEKAPWLPGVRRLLRQGVIEEVPTLGICLGAQLLATALGGHVRTMPDGPEVGLLDVGFAEEAVGDPLFGDVAGSVVPAVQWHWLEADSLPEGARVLASSPACANQAFRIGELAWGVQFHPEALGGTAEDWVEEDRESVAELGLSEDSVIAEVKSAEPRLRNIWGDVAERFAGVVNGRLG